MFVCFSKPTRHESADRVGWLLRTHTSVPINRGIDIIIDSYRITDIRDSADIRPPNTFFGSESVDMKEGRHVVKGETFHSSVSVVSFRSTNILYLIFSES